jgi:hypothetical protein
MRAAPIRLGSEWIVHAAWSLNWIQAPKLLRKPSPMSKNPGLPVGDLELAPVLKSEGIQERFADRLDGGHDRRSKSFLRA